MFADPNGGDSSDSFSDEEFVDEAALEDGLDPDGMEPTGAPDEESAEGVAPEGMVELQDDSVQGFFDHRDAVFAAAINPANPDLVVCGGAEDKGFLFSSANGERVAELGGHSDSVSSVGWNFDGTLCATGGLDGKVKVWDARGELVQTLEGPTGGINWLKWHPRGNALLAGSEDCSSWLWLAPQNKNVAVFFGHAGPVECGDMSTDGKVCVTGSEDCTVRIWRPKDGSCAHVLQGHAFHRAPVVRVAVGRATALLSGDAEGGLRLANLEGHVLGPLSGHTDSIECLAFSETLPLAVSGSMDKSIRVWDLDTLSLRQTQQLPGGVLHVHWHPSQQLILAASADHKIRMWDPRLMALAREWSGPTSIINDLSVSRDWTRFVTAEDAGPVLVFDMRS